MGKYTQEQVQQLQEKQALKEALQEVDDGGSDTDIDLAQVKEQIKRSLLSLRTKQIQTDDGRVVELELLPGQQVVQDEDGGVSITEPDQSAMLCNQDCVVMIFHTIDGHVNPNITNSYLEERDIFHMGYKASAAVATKLYVNQEDYGVDGPADANQIMSIVDSNLKASIKVAYKGRKLKHDEQTRTIREVRTGPSDAEEESGGGGGLFGVFG